jgi:hypothetical protein
MRDVDLIAGIPRRTFPAREVTYATLYAQLKATLAELEARGFARVRHSRFGEYLRLLEVAASVPTGEPIPLASRREDDAFAEAVSQGFQLTASRAIWSLLDPQVLDAKLRHAVQGKPLAPLDDEDDDLPRNTLLELDRSPYVGGQL